MNNGQHIDESQPLYGKRRAEAKEIAAALGLEPLPVEGGFFRRTWTSREKLADGRPTGSAILFMETDAPDGFSALHMLDDDEVYHFYSGDPVALVTIAPDGAVSTITLGPDPLRGQVQQTVVQASVIQGSRIVPGGSWALLGTTMAPAYTEERFRLCGRAELLERYPEHRGLILALTR